MRQESLPGQLAIVEDTRSSQCTTRPRRSLNQIFAAATGAATAAIAREARSTVRILRRRSAMADRIRRCCSAGSVERPETVAPDVLLVCDAAESLAGVREFDVHHDCDLLGG